MRPIGFSTGALCLGDWQGAINIAKSWPAKSIEISTLRECEFLHFIEHSSNIDLSMFEFVSFHVPSKLESLSERELVERLHLIAERNWLLVVHPDIINDCSLWLDFGELLCLENMDGRKSTGRTSEELSTFFERLPRASLCFDIGHARHVDRTMSEGWAICREFGGRIKMIHLSEVDYYGKHVPLSLVALNSFSKLSGILPPNCPVILESPMPIDANIEISRVQLAFSSHDDGLVGII